MAPINADYMGLFWGTMRKFTPKGQEIILKQLKNYRSFYESQGKTMQSFRLWDAPSSICMGTPTALDNELLDKSKNVRELLNELIKKVKNTSVPKGKNTALNVRTGVQEGIYIEEFSEFELFRCGSEPVIKYAKDAAGRIIGKMEVGHSENGTLSINYIATSDEYKGIGKELIRKVVEQSQRLDLKGKVKLTAWTGYLPEDYLQIAGKKSYDVAAAIKYHKMGFKATEPILEQKIVKTIQDGGTGLAGDGKIDSLIGHMELSEEGIRQFLA